MGGRGGDAGSQRRGIPAHPGSAAPPAPSAAVLVKRRRGVSKGAQLWLPRGGRRPCPEARDGLLLAVRLSGLVSDAGRKTRSTVRGTLGDDEFCDTRRRAQGCTHLRRNGCSAGGQLDQRG